MRRKKAALRQGTWVPPRPWGWTGVASASCSPWMTCQVPRLPSPHERARKSPSRQVRANSKPGKDNRKPRMWMARKGLAVLSWQKPDEAAGGPPVPGCPRQLRLWVKSQHIPSCTKTRCRTALSSEKREVLVGEEWNCPHSLLISRGNEPPIPMSKG